MPSVSSRADINLKPLAIMAVAGPVMGGLAGLNRWQIAAAQGKSAHLGSNIAYGIGAGVILAGIVGGWCAWPGINRTDMSPTGKGAVLGGLIGTALIPMHLMKGRMALLGPPAVGVALGALIGSNHRR